MHLQAPRLRPQAVMEQLLLHDSTAGAVHVAEREIQRLLSGRVLMWELVMTGARWARGVCVA